MSNRTGLAAALGLPVTRRVALGALAALPAVTLPERLGAAAEAGSELSQLVAEWRRRVAVHRDLVVQLKDLVADTDLPPDFIRFGRRRILCAETGKARWGRWEAICPADIRAVYAHTRSGIFGPAMAARAERRERALLARLNRQFVRYNAARDAAGITALEELVDVADAARWNQLDAIFAFRPRTIAEYDEKQAFLRERLAESYEFERRELSLIFGG